NLKLDLSRWTHHGFDMCKSQLSLDQHMYLVDEVKYLPVVALNTISKRGEDTHTVRECSSLFLTVVEKNRKESHMKESVISMAVEVVKSCMGRPPYYEPGP
ncbi:hypothetical protein HAX54_037350, partial [Datura stramonium]|nr:hypothetical protein [Datura stramonium]